MRQLMRQCGVIAFRVLEGHKVRHLDIVEFLRVIGAVSAMFDGGVHGRKEFFHALDPGDGIKCRRALGMINFRQAVDLFNVKDGIALQVRNFALGILARFVVMFGPDDGIGEYD